MTTDESLRRLQRIKHIVVLMMENRSFDQMLGYLTRDGLPEVNGLTGQESNRDPAGNEFRVFEWGEKDTVFHPPEDATGKILDPCHSAACVQEQLADDNGGFVANFVATREKDGKRISIPDRWHGLPMGYYSGEHLPVYDHLARNYCVCDAWHSSLPADTWPNRLYALAGHAAPSIGHRTGFFNSVLRRLQGLPVLGDLVNAPIFSVEAFTHHLEDRQWRWYSHDPATLRAADSRYRDIRHLNRDNFTYFDRKRLRLETRALESLIVGHDSFLDDAAKGELRDVSWIDPNFIDLSVLDPNSNDDHPPSDVRAGQAMVLELYEALVNSPNWPDTLLVIVYDEHGGFYDHVSPPSVSDESGFSTLGVRVPALIVGPRVKKFVCHQIFEHTSLISTILRRFAAAPEQALQQMPARVRTAPDLGVVLQGEPRVDPPDHGHLEKQLRWWREDARQARQGQDQRPSPLPGGAGKPLDLHDFQEEFAQFALVMRDSGLPPGQP
jgi:phospholipase C